MATLDESVVRFLEHPHVGVATTLREDGSPHSTVVWVDVEDGVPSFNTAYPRAKPRHLERDPRVALVVVDPSDPYRWVAIEGRAELTTEGADAQIDRLARKYTDAERYMFHRPEETRVIVGIAPTRVEAHGLEQAA